MNLKKKVIYLLSAVFATVLVALSCTACMSAEERRQAEADIKAARPVVEKYLTDNFCGGQVICIDFMQANMMVISGTAYRGANFNIKGVGSITVGLYTR